MKLSQISEFIHKSSYKKTSFLFLAIGGLLTGLTLVFTKLGFLEWLTMVPVGCVLLLRASDRTQKLSSLYLDGFVFFYAYYLVCYHWFAYLYPLEFVDGMTKGGALAVVILAWFGLSLLQALMGGFVFVFAALLFRCSITQKFPYIRVPIAAGLWAVFEWSQTIGWWGVPWGRLPIGQSYYLVGLQTASLFGSYFITFALLAVNFSLAYLLVYPPKWKISIAVSALLLAFQYGAGTVIWFTTDVNKGEAVQVACLQGNISSSDKWGTDSDIKTTQTYEKLIEQASAQGAKLLLLPETAFPYEIDTEYYAHLDKYFSEMAGEKDIWLVVGTYTSDKKESLLNSLVCYSPEGERNSTVYSKRHLVPFGEYVPMRPLIETLFPPLAELVLSSDDIDPGEDTNVIDADGLMLGGLICFDSIYEQLTYDSVRDGAEIICLSTNDSWFSDSAALYMHNAQAQLRAIENRRFLIRSANTGISTVINPRGEIVSKLDPLIEGNVYATAYARNDMSLCTLLGNSFISLIIISFAVIVIFEIIDNIKKQKKRSNLLDKTPTL